MHILIFTSLYPSDRHPYCGVFVQQQIRALAREHQVTVIAPELARLSQLFEPNPVLQTEESWTVHRPRYWYIPCIWWLFYLLSALGCMRQINWKTVDVIHAHVAIPSGFVAAWLSHWYRKPFILTEHTGRFSDLVGPLIRRLTVRWTINQVQRIIVVSHALQDAIEHEGMHGRFAVIPNIVDFNLFYPTTALVTNKRQEMRLLWIGSFASDHYRNKGLPELLQGLAFASVQVTKRLDLTLIGDGIARSEYEALAQKLGIMEQCHFIGQRPHTEIRNWIQETDALILSSHVESFGVVLIEAMACGKPVLATRCGGPADIVTPETGILVEPRDPQALAEGIIQMVKNYKVFNSEQIAAYARKRFSPEIVARQITQVYTEVLRTN